MEDKLSELKDKYYKTTGTGSKSFGYNAHRGYIKTLEGIIEELSCVNTSSPHELTIKYIEALQEEIMSILIKT